MDALEHYRNPEEFHVPATMKAVVLSGTGFENLACREVPVPQIGPDQLLCRVDAAGVCTSILKEVAQGPKHAFINGWDLEKFPVILGDEGSVTVVRVGEGLKDQYRPGQRFAIQPAVDVAPINYRQRYTDGAAGMHKCAVGYTLGGNLAQYIRIQEEVLVGQCLLPLPDENLPYFAVSMAEPISCICSAQDRHVHIFKDGPFGKRQPRLGLLTGGNAVVVGAGAMGLMHAEMAMRFGPRNLLISDILPERLAKAQKVLADKARQLGIRLYTVHADALKETLRQASEGAMADDVIFAIGVQSVQQQGLELLGTGGVANLFGGLPRGKNLLQVDAIAVHYNEIKLVGSSGGEPSDLAAALDAITQKHIDPGNYIHGIGSLDHVPTVLRMIQESKVDGKVIVYPHAPTKELMHADYWDGRREKEYLASHLSGRGL